MLRFVVVCEAIKQRAASWCSAQRIIIVALPRHRFVFSFSGLWYKESNHFVQGTHKHRWHISCLNLLSIKETKSVS